jgi:hypothetical protein
MRFWGLGFGGQLNTQVLKKVKVASTVSEIVKLPLIAGTAIYSQ